MLSRAFCSLLLESGGSPGVPASWRTRRSTALIFGSSRLFSTRELRHTEDPRAWLRVKIDQVPIKDAEQSSPVRPPFINKTVPPAFGWVIGILVFVALSGVVVWLAVLTKPHQN